ncbi:hypothetical protein CSB69_0128 [Morganella morganii]|nr:hypothetical protein CSB69_0128 [Morganella morganii]EMP52013.1 hypothetical protein C790_00483 [Morganella morganii SC01]
MNPGSPFSVGGSKYTNNSMILNHNSIFIVFTGDNTINCCIFVTAGFPRNP